MQHGIEDSICFEHCPIVYAWVNSSKLIWIKPRFQVESVSLKIGKPDMSGYYTELVAEFDHDRGMYRAYVPPRYLKTGGIETRYKITLVDSNGYLSVMGEGKLRVLNGEIPDEQEGADVCYIQFPDGTWREVRITTDELDEYIYTVIGTVYDTTTLGSLAKTPYAYNKNTQKFYALSGVIDESGEATIVVAKRNRQTATHPTSTMKTRVCIIVRNPKRTRRVLNL